MLLAGQSWLLVEGECSETGVEQKGRESAATPLLRASFNLLSV